LLRVEERRRGKAHTGSRNEFGLNRKDALRNLARCKHVARSVMPVEQGPLHELFNLHHPEPFVLIRNGFRGLLSGRIQHRSVLHLTPDWMRALSRRRLYILLVGVGVRVVVGGVGVRVVGMVLRIVVGVGDFVAFPREIR